MPVRVNDQDESSFQILTERKRHPFVFDSVLFFFQSNVAVSRISSISSQDSGFTSQEQFFARPPSPLEESEVKEEENFINEKEKSFLKREADGSTSQLMVVCSTLNAWVKRPEICANGKQPATVTGAPEPIKSCRPAITAHTFDPPSPSLFEKPNWPIYEDGQNRMVNKTRHNLG